MGIIEKIDVGRRHVTNRITHLCYISRKPVGENRRAITINSAYCLQQAQFGVRLIEEERVSFAQNGVGASLGRLVRNQIAELSSEEQSVLLRIGRRAARRPIRAQKRRRYELDQRCRANTAFLVVSKCRRAAATPPAPGSRKWRRRRRSALGDTRTRTRTASAWYKCRRSSTDCARTRSRRARTGCPCSRIDSCTATPTYLSGCKWRRSDTDSTRTNSPQSHRTCPDSRASTRTEIRTDSMPHTNRCSCTASIDTRRRAARTTDRCGPADTGTGSRTAAATHTFRSRTANWHSRFVPLRISDR
ncbi:hypothetical protein BpHYR1_020155 [Brachionus plicatilis]|uniref:Uncharacterized protein n=1 Tax=Brachionus plicatilis TaxID=10195 RepID=A0A3M7PYX0_BRAPC|nr:hypothetical protein BpHYR1_020155 [Brachionus plicatilis]